MMKPLAPWLAALALVALGLALPSPSEAQEAAPTTPPEAAQGAMTPGEARAEVDQARKLMRVRSFAEAIPKLKAAWLVLEDPELLRMLAEAHLGAGQEAEARGFLREYLADPKVGDQAKADAQARLRELGLRDEPAPSDKPKEGGDEDEGDDWGVTGWESSGAKSGRAGQLYLLFLARYTSTPGADYEVARGGEGDDATTQEQGAWDHSGIGGAVEVGWFARDGLSLGGSLGLDVAQWTTRAPGDTFGTTVASGLRPELSANARWYPGWGFQLGLSVGADLAFIPAQVAEPCVVGQGCEAGDESLGNQGLRALYGVLVGYRTEMGEQTSLGLDVSVRRASWVTQEGQAKALPGYGDDGWMFQLGVAFQWNL